jgi:hypothetical protein
MAVRPYAPSDYPLVSTWWAAHQWPVIPEPLLPQTGFISSDICAGFLYRTDSQFALLEWVVADPSSAPAARDRALDELIEALIRRAGELGATVLFTSLRHPRLMERMKRHGFIESDSGMTNLVRRI